MRSSKDQFKAHKRQIELEQYASRNRRTMTASEATLWEELRGGKLGVAFRRQVPLCGRFVADFLAPRARLVVEVDGGHHSERRCADGRRDRVLARHGYVTLRIPARLVHKNPAKATALVVHALAALWQAGSR